MHVSKAAIAALSLAGAGTAVNIVTDVSKINRLWGELSVYDDNAEDAFGVQYVGLPDGCQVESVSTLQRHAERFPDTVDGATTIGFADKVANYSRDNSDGKFEGPLSFLNSYKNIMNNTGYLTGRGGSTEFARGVAFWNRYGRTLFNASFAQLQYEDVFASNGSTRPKITMRSTGQSRIENTQINWSLGFYGKSFNSTPDHELKNWTAPFKVVIIPEGNATKGVENNTLASYDSCTNDNNADNLNIAEFHKDNYKKIYLQGAAHRLQSYAPKGFNFTVFDAFAMQMTCAYEYAFIGMSDFCYLFTKEEWAGFENVLDIQYYYLYGYGNPTGRAQGIGYLQELMARLTHTYIESSNTSVNYTIDNNANDFPLGQDMYADFSHDDIIISVLTSMSMDYFKDPPTLKDYPPAVDGHNRLSKMTPFGANLITETIGCTSENPEPVPGPRIQYHPTQYGYDASKAEHKFIRMRLNNGILPLHTIRGGACGNATNSRLDGLCDMSSFLKSQDKAVELSNYQYACFGNYTVQNSTTHVNYDGTYFEGKNYTAPSE